MENKTTKYVLKLIKYNWLYLSKVDDKITTDISNAVRFDTIGDAMRKAVEMMDKKDTNTYFQAVPVYE